MFVENYDALTGATTVYEVPDIEISFDDLKNQLLKSVDEKTDKFFEHGFTFDNQVFSLSIEAQANWMTLKVLHLTNGIPLEGVTIATKDSLPYILTKENADLFFSACFLTGQIYYASGLAEKTKIYQLLTIEDLKNYMDIRVWDNFNIIENINLIKNLQTLGA